MARRFISWPNHPQIRAVNRLPLDRVYASDASESIGGIDDDTELRVNGKRRFNATHMIPYDYSDGRAAWEWIQHSVKGSAGRIWYPEPCAYWRENVRCGPWGDGINNTFPVPVRDQSIGPFIYVDGNLQESAIISSYKSNLLNDFQAAAIAGVTDGISSYGPGTINTTYEYRYYYGRGLRSSPIGSASNFGWRTDQVDALPSWPLTGVFWAISGTALSIRAEIELFDSLSVSIGTYLGDITPLVPGIWAPIFARAVTPANTAYALLRGYCVTLTSQPWWSDCRGLMLFREPWWFLPSESPYSILLNPAPAQYGVVTASGKGVWSTLCKPRSDNMGETIGQQGHVDVTALDLSEVWERGEQWYA